MIKNCEKCGLYLNQRPLLDEEKDCQIFWVGLSAKMRMSDEESPLSPETNTGMLIKKIENRLEGVGTYRTNLVKCVPLNNQKKLRYPNKNEIDSCFANLQREIEQLNPKIVFLLGEKVYSSVEKHLNIQFEKWDGFEYHYKKYNGTYYIPIHHPSYIYVYKRKKMSEYIQSVVTLINELL